MDLKNTQLIQEKAKGGTKNRGKKLKNLNKYHNGMT